MVGDSRSTYLWTDNRMGGIPLGFIYLGSSLNWPPMEGVQWSRWRVLGGRRDEERGCGDVVCLCGMRKK